MTYIKPKKQKEMKRNDDGLATVFDRLLAQDYSTYEAFLPLQTAIKQTSLDEALREALITFVSMKNGCDYCTKSHSQLFNELMEDDDAASWLKDYRNSPLPDEWKLLLSFADHITDRPVTDTKHDIEKMKSTGYTEQEIVEITQVIGYTTYTNQLSMAMGL